MIIIKKTIYDYKDSLKEEYGINYIELDWDLSQLEDKNKDGVFLINLVQKEAKWFEGLHELRTFINGDKRLFDDDYSYSNEISNKLGSKENKIVSGYFVCYAWDFDKDIANKNYKFAPVPLENDSGESFDNIDDAAEYIKDKGISGAKHKTIVNSIKRNLAGETKKSYGRVWKYKK